MSETEMGDLVIETIEESVVDPVLEMINDTVNSTASEAKTPSTPEGMAIAYGSLVFMALLPIFLGSFRSVKQEYEEIPSEPADDDVAAVADRKEGIIDGLFVGSRPPGEPVDGMTSRDAAMFPLIASGALLCLYGFFKVFSASSVNWLLTCYFFVLGIFALAHLLTPIVARISPECLKRPTYQLMFLKRDEDEQEWREMEHVQNRNRLLPEEVFNLAFDKKDVLTLSFCVLVGCWYFLKKHWIANNLFGLAFAINGVEFLQLPRVSTGLILLVGLFFYDIFWVFGTDVMITVAKSFEAPIKLVFPQDILENGPLEANNFAMLGLGDIVIPGIFIALLLRFDLSRDTKKVGAKPYFYVGFIAYFLGLLLTIFVMHVYKHAQPALLYLVPSCLGAPLLLALAKGDLMQLMNYEDEQGLPDLVEDEGWSEGEEREGEGTEEVEAMDEEEAVDEEAESSKKDD